MKANRGAGNSLKNNPPPIELATADRLYYRERWGFDPITDCALVGSGKFRYEAWFPLEADLGLNAASVEIGARVNFDASLNTINRIVFRVGGRGGKEAEITCTHLVLYNSSIYEIGVQTERNHITRGQHAFKLASPAKTLPPWEHFVALKSWVAAIAEMGLGNIIKASWQPQGKSERHPRDGEEAEIGMASLLPFGFNAGMQAQVVQALNLIASNAAAAIVRDFLLETLDDAPKKWVDDQIWSLATTFASPGIVDALEIRTTQDPGNPYAWGLLGLIRSEIALHIPLTSPPEPALAMHEAAKKAVEQATTIDSGSPGCWADLGRVIRFNFRKPRRSWDNNLRKAATAMKRALKLNPQNARWWAFLGEIYSDLSDPYNAANAFERATALNPNNTDYWDDLGNELEMLEDYEGALKSYNRGLQVNPNSLPILHHLINFYRKLEDWGKVIELCELVLLKHPHEIHHWNILAAALERVGRETEALYCYERYLPRDSLLTPSSPDDTPRAQILRGLAGGIFRPRVEFLRKKGIQPVAPSFVTNLGEET